MKKVGNTSRMEELLISALWLFAALHLQLKNSLVM